MGAGGERLHPFVPSFAPCLGSPFVSRYRTSIAPASSCEPAQTLVHANAVTLVHMRLSYWSVGLLVLVSLFVASCDSRSPLDREVKAGSTEEWQAWQSRGYVPADYRADFDKAIQELKIRVMNEKGTSQSDVLNEGMRARIHGNTLREVLIAGFQARRDRLERERLEVQARLDHDSRLKTREGDVDSAAYLNSILQPARDRIATLQNEVKAIDAKIRDLGAEPQLCSPPAENKDSTTRARPDASIPLRKLVWLS
jgi:hypothetical protein